MSTSTRSITPGRLAAQHPAAVILISLSFVMLAVLWALLSQAIYRGIGPFPDSAPDNYNSVEYFWFRFAWTALFGRPWFAFALGLGLGVLFVLPQKRRLRVHFDECVSDAMGLIEGTRRERFSRTWSLFKGNLIGIVGFLGAILVLPVLFGVSLKVLLYSSVAPVALLYPERKKLYSALAERCTSDLDEPAARAFRRSARRNIVLVNVCAFPVLALIVGFAFAIAPDIREMRWHSYEMSGWSLSDADAQKYEKRLERNPGDVPLRATLLGYYTRRISTAEGRRNYYRHALWLIENEPLIARDIVIDGLFDADAETDAAALERAKALWRRHVAERPTDAEILFAAGEFMMRHNTDDAAALFTRAKEHAGEGSELSHKIVSREAELAARRLQREREAQPH